MSLIVDKSKETIDRLTQHGIAFYTTGQFFLEEYYALALVGKAGLNTLHMSVTTGCWPLNALTSIKGWQYPIVYSDCSGFDARELWV